MALFILVQYLLMSIIIGLADVASARRQARDFANVPNGDIGEYLVPKKIFGPHNWVFLPSWLVIGVAILLNRLLDK